MGTHLVATKTRRNKISRKRGPSGGTVRQRVVRKVEPLAKSGEIQPELLAIVSYLLNQDWTTPKITDLVVTPDAMVLASISGQVGHGVFLSSLEDVTYNMAMIAGYVGLTNEEEVWFRGEYRRKLTML